VYDLETSRIGAPYIYDISNLRGNLRSWYDAVKNPEQHYLRQSKRRLKPVTCAHPLNENEHAGNDVLSVTEVCYM